MKSAIKMLAENQSLDIALIVQGKKFRKKTKNKT